eukprot:TRINITY_DN2133_c0_g1_i5.p1 TRINITY_DN2133_c0_g1~~TRINITY_DN2133_c0_g1_i5.p1  ORF type:complete len:232 (+),score=41.84 TRINITY_DN2133_c0_g1_i5:356-1051(+)
MALLTHPTSPPRVSPWQLSAWPEKDPECKECGGHGSNPAAAHEDSVIEEIQGSPCPAKKEHVMLQKESMRMMMVLSERSFAPEKPGGSEAAITKDRRRAFEIFQTVVKGERMMYAFDLEQAFETAGVKGIDQHQISVLMHKFNLQPGDPLPFDHFSAMCDTLLSGQIPPHPSSPPRDLTPPCPGSPEYKAGKKEKPSAKTFRMANSCPFHLQMDQKMQVPQKARVQHGFGK